MPNARARKRTARDGDGIAEKNDTQHPRRNAKRPKVVTKKAANRNQPASKSSAGKTKAKPVSKSSSSSSSCTTGSSASSSSTSTSTSTGCFNTTWTPKEDQRLKQIVMELYPDGKVGADISWIDVADKMGTYANGRTAKQVRERWHNSLRPDLKKKGAPWSEKETATLIRLQGEMGNSWAKISKKMSCGRSQNDIKNKWNSLMKNQVFLVAYNNRQNEVAEKKNGDGTSTSKKKKIKASSSGGASKGIAKFAAAIARKLCSRSNYTRNDEDEDLASTSEESDASDSEDEGDNETNARDISGSVATDVFKDDASQDVQVEGCEMTEDGYGHILRDVEQSESQLEFGRKLEQYKWAVEQEKRIEMFRRGRLDSGLTCSDVERLKLMGLGLGVAALQKKYFGIASSD